MMDLIFIHGWGQSSLQMRPLAEKFQKEWRCHCLDLPGFGGTDAPPTVWGSDDYARLFIKRYMDQNNIEKAVLIGHSFGGKVAMETAIQFPEKTQGLVLIASAGLKRKRSLVFKGKSFFLKMLSRGAGLLDRAFKTKMKERYGRQFGSSDYRAAQGVMKSILIRSVNEDLTVRIAKIKSPTLIIFGQRDEATPPELGHRLHRLIEGSDYVEIPHQDHYSLIGDGRFQTQNQIQNFFKNLSN